MVNILQYVNGSYIFIINLPAFFTVLINTISTFFPIKNYFNYCGFIAKSS